MDSSLKQLNPHGLKPRCSSKTLAAGETVRLDELKCQFIQLHNWTANAGTVSDTGVPVSAGGTAPTPYTPTTGAGTTVPEDAVSGSEIYYGFDGGLCGQIFPGERTDILPCTNLHEVTLRPGPQGAREVFFTYWT